MIVAESINCDLVSNIASCKNFDFLSPCLDPHLQRGRLCLCSSHGEGKYECMQLCEKKSSEKEIKNP